MDCKVLILDEPTSSLDEKEVEKLFSLMRSLKQKGVGILFVTHFLEQVYEVCDRVTVMGTKGQPCILLILLVLAIGVVFGLVQGVLVGYLQIQPFIVTMKQANADDKCAGVITWCHTFSPSKMWIHGLQLLQKPWCHFATQYNRHIPNEEIDMVRFLSAAGGRDGLFVIDAVLEEGAAV